jgi:NitT/TauT family transport system substrate-binding protein
MLVVVSSSSVRAQTLTKIRVATLPIDVASQALYAADQGFFRAAGLDVDLQLMNSGPAIAAAIAGGDVDFGASNMVTLSIAHERGVPFVLVAPGGAYSSKNPTDKLVVANGSPIKTARDLNGKALAVNALKNISAISAMSWIDRNGGDSKTVKFVELPFSEMGAAIASGRIDAACMDEPFLGQAIAVDHLSAIALPYEAVGKEFLQGAWFTSTEYAKAHPDVVRKFADAMAKAADWANANPSSSGKILEKYTKTALVAGTARTYFPPRFVRLDVQPLVDAAAKYGVLKETIPVGDMFAPGITFSN